MDDLERTLSKDEQALEVLQLQAKRLSDKIKSERAVLFGDKVQRLNALRKEYMAMQANNGKTRRDVIRREALQSRISDLQNEIKQLKTKNA